MKTGLKMSSALTLGLLALLLTCADGNAAPNFARKYKTSCSTCHYAYPKLNAFGKAFFNNGYRYPAGQDAEMTKEEPVSLGSESQKRVFPDAVWPADIPGTSPLSVHAISRAYYKPDSEVKTYFEFPHELEVLFGGTLGETFSMFGEVELEIEDNEVETAFPFSLQYDYRPWLHAQVGTVNPDFTGNQRRLTREHNNVVSLRGRNGWRLRDGQSGVEVWGARNGSGGRGGLTYGVGLVNGQDIIDANSEKDLYVRAAYKFKGLGELGGTEGQASETSAFYVDDSAKIGGFAYLGTTAKEGAGDEDLTALGLTCDLWYRRANLSGALMSMSSKISGAKDRTSLAWFAEGNYVVYPWLIGVARYERTDADTDDDTRDPVTTLIPAVVAVARPNIKFSLEYKLPLDDASKKTKALVMQMNYAF
ncbi:MAG: hypothetical protein HYW07_10925 [Candidatus Latescibacteria bacterium]|nr:hypothetical protein [Candidatus Latescibacterota bacterium]